MTKPFTAPTRAKAPPISHLLRANQRPGTPSPRPTAVLRQEDGVTPLPHRRAALSRLNGMHLYVETGDGLQVWMLANTRSDLHLHLDATRDRQTKSYVA